MERSQRGRRPRYGRHVGRRLIAEDAAEALTHRLFPLATVITPNIPEAMALLDYEVDSERTQQNAAMLLTRRFGCASLVKGGHLSTRPTMC